MQSIDLNCDVGEGAGHDAELMPFITSANIACGAHAGDEATMRATVRLAMQHGVAIGAHPGFADRENFGRTELPVSPSAAYELVLEQIRHLQAIATEDGAWVVQVKPHGALYNMAARDEALARAVAAAVYEADAKLLLCGLAGSRLVEAGIRCGLNTLNEVFADRSYLPDGSLTPRSRPDAMISDESVAVAQAMRMVREGKVRATDGNEVTIKADTICLHGDGPQAVAFARRISAELKNAGIAIRPPSV